MNNSNPRKKLIIAAVIFGIICIIAIIFAVVQTNKQSESEAQPEVKVYVDPYSGEELIETEGKVDEAFDNEEITYLGFSKLLDYGMTSEQVDILKTYILQYSYKRISFKESAIKEVTIDFNTYTQGADNNTGERTVTFDMIMNRDENQRLYVINRSPTLSVMWTEIYKSDKTTELFNAEEESFGDNH